MRAVFLVLIVAILGLIVAVMSGLVHLPQTREAVAPGIESSNGKIVVREGQTPAFKVETGTVGVTTNKSGITIPKIEIQPSNTRIGVPTIEVRRPGTAQAPAPAPVAPAPAPAPQGNKVQ
jgi:hypothetical protein